MKQLTLILTDRFYPEEFIINDLVTEIQINSFKIEVLTQNPTYPFGNVDKFEQFSNKLYQQTEYRDILVRRLFTVQGYRESKIKKILHYLNFAILGSIFLILRGQRYNKIFVFQTGPLTQAIPAIICKIIYKSKVIIWTLDLWPDAVFAYGFKKTKVFKTTLNYLVKWIYTNCDTILVSSSGFIKNISLFVPNKEIKFIPQWAMNFGEVSKDYELDKTKFNFSFTGNIAKTQNLENVILGFNKALAQNSQMCLNIFGDGSYLDSLKGLVLKQNIQNVLFWGRLPQNQMNSIMHQSKILVISLSPDPLYEYYIPLKFSSYLSSNKPIFAVMRGEVPKLIKKYNIGDIADPADLDEIALKFIKMSNYDSTAFDICSTNTQSLLTEMFSRSKVINKILDELF
jgi:glycosyltransferase involved in cell wall biosynthesis